MLSLEDYQALETAALLRSPANAKRLLAAVAQLKAGKGNERDLRHESSFSPMPRGRTIATGKRTTPPSSRASTTSSARSSANRYSGIGKPESLRHALEGFWSRRISSEQRIVYRVEDDVLLIAQLRVVA